MSTQETNTQDTRPWDFERIARETGRVIVELAKVTGKAAEELTGLMVIRADHETRSKLDMIVESGALKSRHEALDVLVKAGMQQKQRIFDQIEKTRAEIAVLKSGLKNFTSNS